MNDTTETLKQQRERLLSENPGVYLTTNQVAALLRKSGLRVPSRQRLSVIANVSGLPRDQRVRGVVRIGRQLYWPIDGVRAYWGI